VFCFFFFQAEDGIRDGHVTGVQTCALPISTVTALTADVFAVSAVTVARGSPYRVNSASKRRCDSLQALVGQDDRSSLADGVRNVAPEPPAYPYPHILPTNAGKSRGWPTRENFRLDSSDCRRKGLALGSLPPTYRKRAPSHPRFEGYRNL